MQVPVVVGAFRVKSMLGGHPAVPLTTAARPSVAAALLAAERGANIVRVHDVAATRDALELRRMMQTKEAGDR